MYLLAMGTQTAPLAAQVRSFSSSNLFSSCREVVRWLKGWDPAVFGTAAPDQLAREARGMGSRFHQQQQRGQAHGGSGGGGGGGSDPLGRPEHKVILIAGPPGGLQQEGVGTARVGCCRYVQSKPLMRICTLSLLLTSRQPRISPPPRPGQDDPGPRVCRALRLPPPGDQRQRRPWGRQPAGPHPGCGGDAGELAILGCFVQWAGPLRCLVY